MDRLGVGVEFEGFGVKRMVVGGDGREYEIVGEVELMWHKRALAKSFVERFLVVDGAERLVVMAGAAGTEN